MTNIPESTHAFEHWVTLEAREAVLDALHTLEERGPYPGLPYASLLSKAQAVQKQVYREEWRLKTNEENRKLGIPDVESEVHTTLIQLASMALRMAAMVKRNG